MNTGVITHPISPDIVVVELHGLARSRGRRDSQPLLIVEGEDGVSDDNASSSELKSMTSVVGHGNV